MDEKSCRQGSITIYMALILSVMLALFLVMIDGARKNAILVQAECGFDLAIYSVFAEYNRALLEQYDLLFIDTSYCGTNPSISKLTDHFSYYLKENLSDRQDSTSFGIDLTQTYLDNVDLTNLSFATDDKGAVLQRQAIMYMEEKYGISYIKDLKREYETAEEYGLFSRDVTAEREANQRVIDETKIPPKETGEYDEDGNPITEEVLLNNPADGVNASRPKGILYFVTNADDTISGQTIEKKNCVSQRSLLFEGDGLSQRDKVLSEERLLFDAYIMDHFGTYTEPKTEGQLQYQVEYILVGKDSDLENLKAIVNRLLLLRETANMVYLFSDAAKIAEAETLAVSICTAAGVPVLIEPVKLSILFAWAYAESLYDVKMLLSGSRVPLMKTFETWHYSLEGMLHYEESLNADLKSASNEGQNSNSILSIKDGLSYTDYLRLFLFAKKNEEKVLASMDVIEADIRRTKGNQDFKLDGCVDQIYFYACVGSKTGHEHEMESLYYYK